jgi:hypothetical protein
LFDNLQFLKLELTFWIYPTTICSGLVANQPQFSKHRERLLVNTFFCLIFCYTLFHLRIQCLRLPLF